MRPIDQFHKWVEWSDEDQVYIGKCPDLITGIHAKDPIKLYKELNILLEEVIHNFKKEKKPLPIPTVRPMQEVI